MRYILRMYFSFSSTIPGQAKTVNYKLIPQVMRKNQTPWVTLIALYFHK